MKSIFVIIFCLFTLFLGSTITEKRSSLPDFINPQFISVTNNEFIAADQTTIYILSLKDLKVKKKFGQKRRISGKSES